jgi:hypothetical protein
MVFQVCRKNEDVVEVDDNEDIGHVVEDVVHEILEGHWRVGHTEGHYQIFE